MSVMVLDAGNSIIKAKIARRKQGEIAFPHAIRQLSESEYEKILPESGSMETQMIIFESTANPMR